MKKLMLIAALGGLGLLGACQSTSRNDTSMGAVGADKAACCKGEGAACCKGDKASCCKDGDKSSCSASTNK